jgi:ketosteroid isomerase-like protein
MKVVQLVAALGLGLGGAGCARADHQAVARQAIARADSAFAQATAEHGVDGWVSWFADSGVEIVPGRNLVGRAAIRARMTPELSDTAHLLTWHPVTVEASETGDLGYSIGRWALETRAAAATASPLAQGSYVTIWRKQGDGTWKVVLDIGNADPAR